MSVYNLQVYELSSVYRSYSIAMSLLEYIHEFTQAVASENSQQLRRLLTINPGGKTGPKRAAFPEPNDVDLYSLPEKFQPVVRAYLQLMKSIYVTSDISASFHNINNLLIYLNRAAETQTNWICLALINCSDELISLHQVMVKQKAESDNSSLETVANTINKSFKMCLTDKTLDMAVSKKASIHFFLAALIKIYFRLHRLELAKSMERALVGTGLAVPTIIHSPVEYRKHIVTYLYFSALLSLDEGDFAFAETKLLTAMEFLSCYRKRAKVAAQEEKILFLLVPLKLHTARALLPDAVYDRFPSLRFLYKENLVDAILTGNLRKFDECMTRFQTVFLKRHIYLLAVHLKSLCYLRLIRRTSAAYAQLDLKTPHIVPFSAFQVGLEFSAHNKTTDGKLVAPASLAKKTFLVSTEELECILANLISKRHIKGYISHANKCVVLLKTDAFPSGSTTAR